MNFEFIFVCFCFQLVDPFWAAGIQKGKFNGHNEAKWTDEKQN